MFMHGEETRNAYITLQVSEWCENVTNQSVKAMIYKV